MHPNHIRDIIQKAANGEPVTTIERARLAAFMDLCGWHRDKSIESPHIPDHASLNKNTNEAFNILAQLANSRTIQMALTKGTTVETEAQRTQVAEQIAKLDAELTKLSEHNAKLIAALEDEATAQPEQEDTDAGAKE